MSGDKKIIIIAGPNGAGKTTFAREYLPQEAACLNYVNADLIASGLSPFSPEASAVRAGRIMLAEIASHARQGESFAFETTLSGLIYARMIPEWRENGYGVRLLYLALENIDIALRRIAARVEQGGHDVPADIVERRYVKGLSNFRSVYLPLVDEWALYDNSGDEPVLLEKRGDW